MKSSIIALSSVAVACAEAGEARLAQGVGLHADTSARVETASSERRDMRNAMRTWKKSGTESLQTPATPPERRRPRSGPRRTIPLLIAAAIALPLGVMAPLAAPSAQALDNGLALTPPMGWNSWNQVHCNDLSEAAVKSAVDEIVDRGLKSVGYEYVVVDDCWQGGRDDHGELFADPVRFPSGIEALATYVHDAGLKFGIYSSPGSETCANYWDGYPVKGIASFGHEAQDAQIFADWGVDYLKYDWCRADVTNGLERPAAFAKMRDALAATGRPIVYGISEYGETKPWTWAGPVANLWRTTGDIGPRWSSVLSIVNSQAGLSSYAGPGAWNDPDMLQIGNGSMTLAENRSHFGMWAMLAAPLFLGTDVSALSADVLAVVGNREIVDIDQDPLGAQAERISNVGGAQVWARRLAGDELAVALLNTSDQAQTITTSLSAVQASGDAYVVRDAWAQKDLYNATRSLSARVGAHDTVILRLAPGTDPALPGLVTASGAGTLSQGRTGVVPVVVSNSGAVPLEGATLTVSGVDGVDTGDAPYPIPSVPAGGEATVDVSVSVSTAAALGEKTLPMKLSTGGDGSVSVTVVPPAPSTNTHVSDLPFVRADAGWGQVRKDVSVEQRPLTVNGTVTQKGIGTHAKSAVQVWLGAQCTRLVGALGIDDETSGGDTTWGTPSIGGEISGDGGSLWRADGVIGYRQRQDFSLDVRGVEMLTLVVDDAGNGNAYDHADWLDMQLECAPVLSPVVTSSAPVLTVRESATVTAAHLRPGSTATFELHSEPVVLGTAVADDEGVARLTFTVPAVDAGEHELIAIGEDAAGSAARASVTVTVERRTHAGSPCPHGHGAAHPGRGLGPRWLPPAAGSRCC